MKHHIFSNVLASLATRGLATGMSVPPCMCSRHDICMLKVLLNALTEAEMEHERRDVWGQSEGSFCVLTTVSPFVKGFP